MALLRALPRKRSESPGIATTRETADSNSVCMPASSAWSSMAGSRNANPQALELAGRSRREASS